MIITNEDLFYRDLCLSIIVRCYNAFVKHSKNISVYDTSIYYIIYELST